jgi:hypothetical protein
MKLTYRGVGYDYKPAQVESRESAIAGKYRGAGLKFRTTIARVPVLQPALDLIYRGTHYRLGGTQPNCVKEPVTLMGNNRRFSIAKRQFNVKCLFWSGLKKPLVLQQELSQPTMPMRLS